MPGHNAGIENATRVSFGEIRDAGRTGQPCSDDGYAAVSATSTITVQSGTHQFYFLLGERGDIRGGDLRASRRSAIVRRSRRWIFGLAKCRQGIRLSRALGLSGHVWIAFGVCGFVRPKISTFWLELVGDGARSWLRIDSGRALARQP